MSEIALRLQDVHVAYGNSQQSVLSGFSMSVRKGEIACLLGASGCGKTTVLRAVAGFERLRSGEIYVSQRRVAGSGVHLPPEKRHVGMVFQEYALFPHLTAQQNVAFGLRRMPREQQQVRVAELLKMVELHSHAAVIRMNCPAVNSSVSLLRARWRRIRKSCCSMSLSPALISARVSVLATRCGIFCVPPGKRHCWLHTANTRRS